MAIAPFGPAMTEAGDMRPDHHGRNVAAEYRAGDGIVKHRRRALPNRFDPPADRHGGCIARFREKLQRIRIRISMSLL
ncbi:MAG: hypothetical protein M1457_11610 [bacterium]|nr:hypothetical protein [bacterium]